MQNHAWLHAPINLLSQLHGGTGRNFETHPQQKCETLKNNQKIKITKLEMWLKW